jgi:prepilin-type N-terminal cleavage/methylation domain-containing protein
MPAITRKEMRSLSRKPHSNVKVSPKRAAFTLIELMVVVGILGVLAAIAIPAFSLYVRRARSAEGGELLKQIFMNVAAYYHPDRQETSGIYGNVSSACVVDSANNHVLPAPTKQQGTYTDGPWMAMNFTIGYSYFRYEIETLGGPRCLIAANTAPLYYLRARGDLDGDGVQSMMELAVGSDGQNYLYHSRGFYMVNENE